MSKQIEALKLALKAMNLAGAAHGQMLLSDPPQEAWKAWGVSAALTKAMTAASEALAEQPAQGCDYCNHPQYAGTKCKNCGREKPAQQREPVAWMKDCADFWEHYTYISEASQENYKAEAQMWVEKLRTSPPASKPWVGLTDEEFEEIELGCRSTLFGKIEAMRKVEAKLREKNT